MESSLEVRHLKSNKYRRQKWKNGRGVTFEIAADPHPDVRWRITSADLPESAPFSQFEGYDRSLVLLAGGPVTLSIGGREVALVPMSPIYFPGEENVSASVEKPGVDFNVFTRRGVAKAGVHPTLFQKGEDYQFPLRGSEHFLFVMQGEVEVLEPSENRTLRLQAKDTLSLSRIGEKEWMNLRGQAPKGPAVCIWVVLRTEAL